MPDFNNIYINSKDPRIQALFEGTCGRAGIALDITNRYNAALKLALSGLTIDPQIDAENGDPLLVMQARELYNYVKVPALLEKIPTPFLPPGIHMPGIPDYDPTLYSIVVSSNPDNYPPWSGPVSSTKYVGPYAGNGLYNAINGAEKLFTAGQALLEDGINYTFLPVPTLGEYFWQFVSKG